ncbi:MAG: ThiF family adenylyltransferase [Nitrosarchaeum sp.]
MNPEKILFTNSDIRKMMNRFKKYGKDGMEDSYSMVGIIHDNGVYEIKKCITFGDNVERTEVSCSTDPEEIKKVLIKHPGWHYLGDGHLHPWHVKPEPSHTDINQLREARRERHWTIMAVHSLDTVKFFGMDRNDKLVNLDYQIVSGVNRDNLLARNLELIGNGDIRKFKISILGFGTLGCGVVESLACSGIDKFLVADMDTLSDVNVGRHLGSVYDIGADKVEIAKKYIESHNPYAFVKIVKDDLIKNRELLREIINWSDIVISSSGNPALQYQINIHAVEMKKTVVYGGVFEKAESSYVFFSDPNVGKACFEDIFGIASAAIDNGTIKRKYGLDDDELKSEPGLFSNILVPGAMMGTIAIDLMMGNIPEFNLVRYYKNLKVERFSVDKKTGCPTCDPDGVEVKRQTLVDGVKQFFTKFRRIPKID